jgi:hypothetical protein
MFRNTFDVVVTIIYKYVKSTPKHASSLCSRRTNNQTNHQ